MSMRSDTFIVSAGQRHRRTHSDHCLEALEAAIPPAAVEPIGGGHRPVSKRLSLETRPIASTSQPPPARISTNGVPQLRITDDVGNPAGLGWARRRGLNTRNEDELSSGNSSSDDGVTPERQRRPQSAWNTRSGRRPQFTFSDMDEGGDEERSMGHEERRRSSGSGGSDGGLKGTPKKTGASGLRASQIPVRTDRFHPSGRTDDRTRRHSVFAISRYSTADAASRDSEVAEESASGWGQQMSLSPAQSFRRRSLTGDDQQEARRRVLARLASEPPETEMTSSPVARRPRKLNPILSPPNDVVVANSEHSAVMTSPEVNGVISGVGGGGIGDISGQNGLCRPRPAVCRKAKELLMM